LPQDKLRHGEGLRGLIYICFMDYNSQFNRQQQAQGWMPPSMPPEPKKPSRSWIIWVIVIAAVISLVGLVGYKVWKAGSRKGHFINKEASSAMNKLDSTATNTHEEKFQELYGMLGTDSASNAIRAKLDALHASTDSLVTLLGAYHDGFQDTMRGAGGLSQFDKSWAHNYFIVTGRATKLKNKLLYYRASSIHNLPADQQDSSLAYIIIIDDLQKSMPGFMKKFTRWEYMYFDQPAMNVNMNLTLIRTEIRSFEGEILQRWENAIKSLPPTTDSIGVIII